MAASASFEEFYAATVDRLLGHLFLVTGDLYVAEEILQRPSLAPRCVGRICATTTSPKPGYGGVENLAADRARSLRRQTRALLKLGPPPAVPAVSVETLALVQARPCRSANARPSCCTTWPTSRSRRSPRRWPCPADR